MAEISDTLDLQGRRLLLVEDEPIVRRHLAELLCSDGGEVVACADSGAALEAFRGSPWGFHLIVTDQTMPGMSGAEMLREVRDLNDEVPVLMLSGYANVLSDEQRARLRIGEVLLKPLMAEDVEAAIQRLLIS